MTNYVFYDWTAGGLPELLFQTENATLADDAMYYLSEHFDLRVTDLGTVIQVDVKKLGITPLRQLKMNITRLNNMKMGDKV